MKKISLDLILKGVVQLSSSRVLATSENGRRDADDVTGTWWTEEADDADVTGWTADSGVDVALLWRIAASLCVKMLKIFQWNITLVKEVTGLPCNASPFNIKLGCFVERLKKFKFLWNNVAFCCDEPVTGGFYFDVPIGVKLFKMVNENLKRI